MGEVDNTGAFSSGLLIHLHDFMHREPQKHMRPTYLVH